MLRNGTWTTRYTQASLGRHLTVFEAVAVDTSARSGAVGWDRDDNAPGETGSQDQLLSVAAVSPASVWAAGYTSPPSGGNATLTLKGSDG
jgi:hypothetical protein